MSSGADINLQTEKQNTALIMLAKAGDERVKLLLEKGADPTITNADGLTALSYAAEKSHKNVVKIFLESKNAKVTSLNRNGSSALSHSRTFEILFLLLDYIKPTQKDIEWLNGLLHEFAMREERIQEMSALLEIGAEINSRNQNGDTAFIISARASLVDNIELLARHGADPLIKNNLGQTAFDVAINSVKLTVYRIEREHACADIAGKILNTAWQSKLVSAKEKFAIETLFNNFKERGGVPETVVSISSPIFLKMSFLHAACFLNLLEVVKEIFKIFSCTGILKQKNPIEVKDMLEQEDVIHFSTPLMFAAQGNSVDVLNYLLDEGAEIDVKNRRQYTTLYYAVRNNSYAAASFLLARGANTDGYYDDLPLLHVAVENENEKIVSLLIQHAHKRLLTNGLSKREAAKEIICSLEENKTLLFALGKNNAAIIVFLLEQGVDIAGYEEFAGEQKISLADQKEFYQQHRAAIIRGAVRRMQLGYGLSPSLFCFSDQINAEYFSTPSAEEAAKKNDSHFGFISHFFQPASTKSAIAKEVKSIENEADKMRYGSWLV